MPEAAGAPLTPPNPDEPQLLETDGVGFRYAGARTDALRHVSLSVREGELVCLAGPNGCGKSTLLRLAAGALRPASGSLRVGGRSFAALDARARSRLIALLPQSELPVPWMTGLEMTMLGRLPHLQGLLAFESAHDVAVCRRALERADAAAFESRRLGTLSGGERQLVLIARALAQEPRFLLLDEPSASLDLAHQQRLFRLLRDLARNERLGILAVTHDLNLAALAADRLVLMADGAVQAAGTPAEVLQEATLARVFKADVWTSTSPSGQPCVGLRP